MVPWFPIVGALIGAAVGLIAAGLSELFPAGPTAALAVIAGLLVTGAFHEDGLADVADAFGGGTTREQRFEILKDSRHGTYGVAALSSSIVLRIVCAASIATPAALLTGFVAAHTLGRTAAVVALTAVPPASDSGLGADSARDVHRVPAAIGALAGLGLVALVGGWWVGPLAAAALIGAAAVSWLAIRKIGGIAGDVLGAVEQVAECLVLVVVSALAMRHDPWWTT